MPSFLASTAAKLIAGLALLLLVVSLVLYFKWDDAAQPKQDARSANAVAETAKETAETVIERAKDDATLDQLVAETAKQIDTLPLPEAAKAARKAICSLVEYAKDPQCQK